MTLRLRAHREVVEEYLHSIGQYMHRGGDVAGAIDYDDVPSISSAHNRDLAAPSSGPPFEVLQSANTLAMLLRVFVEKQQKDEQNKKKDEAIESSPSERPPQGSPLRSSSDHPFNQRSTFAQALTPRPTRNNNASPSPNINASFSPTSELRERTETIDCWIDEGELMLSTETLRRFKSAAGLDKKPQDPSAVLGRRLLLPPELAQKRLSQTKIVSSNEVSVAHATDIHAPLDVALTRPPVTIVRQKKSLVGARAATLPPIVDAPKPTTADKNSIAESDKAQSTPAPPADKQSLSGSPTAAPTAVGEQESLIADIHRMVKEMRDSATTMKETLAAEAGVMDDAAQLLLDATNKTKTQIRNVEAIGGYTASENAGLIERLLRKVLPSAVVGMLMHSLSALIALLKTILLVFTIILITGSTLFIIVSRRKPQSVVIYEE